MISLYVDKGIAHVWNSDDWHILRSRHRICGALIGSIASFPRQNDFQGLPMALLSEETALLVEKGICQLFELPTINEVMSGDDIEELKQMEQRQLQDQLRALRKRKIEQITQKIDLIVAGKRQKLLSKGITSVNIDKEQLLQEEINKLPEVASAHTLVHLPTEHYIETEKRQVNIDVLVPSVTDLDGSKRFVIFKDLWEKGKYVTSGSKFGADFLVYPGDPVRFHASYMLRCINADNAYRPIELVAFGRLAVAVNKMAVLAFCNGFGKIVYQTLQWHDSLYG